jgi:hypothetical protein
VFLEGGDEILTQIVVLVEDGNLGGGRGPRNVSRIDRALHPVTGQAGGGHRTLGEVREFSDAADDKEMRDFFGVDVFDRCADAGRAQGPEQKRDFVALDQLPGLTLAA